MATIFEQLKNQEAEQAAQAADAYRKLIDQVASGKAVSAVEAAAVLKAAGRSAGDLESAVARLGEIERCKAVILDRADAEKEAAELGKELEELRAEIAANAERLRKWELEWDARRVGNGQRRERVAAAEGRLRQLEKECE